MPRKLTGELAVESQSHEPYSQERDLAYSGILKARRGRAEPDVSEDIMRKLGKPITALEQVAFLKLFISDPEIAELTRSSESTVEKWTGVNNTSPTRDKLAGIARANAVILHLHEQDIQPNVIRDFLRCQYLDPQTFEARSYLQDIRANNVPFVVGQATQILKPQQ